MYTVCPKCALTLVVTAADLRVAQGFVRCGRCSNVFNALARLSDKRRGGAEGVASATLSQPIPPPQADTAAEPDDPDADGPAEPDELRGPAAEASRPAARAAHREQDDEAIPETALEFNPESTDVSKVFVEQAPDPQWSAATGKFKALIRKAQSAAQSATQGTAKSAPQSGVKAPAQGAPKSAVQTGASTAPQAPSQAAPQNSSQAAPQSSSQAAAPASAPAAAQATPHAASQTAPPAVQRPTPRSPPVPAPAQAAAVRHTPSATQPPAPAAAQAPANSANDASIAPDGNSQFDVEIDAAFLAATAQLKPQLDTVAQTKRQPALPAANGPEESRTEPGTVSRAPRAPSAHAEQIAEWQRERHAEVASEFEIESETAAAPADAPRPTPLSYLWSAGTGALAILLMAQIVHHYRHDLATNEKLYKPLTALYSALGVPLVPRWNLTAYDVRQLGASADNASAGQIMVRASVKNTAKQAQPLPLLRVTLQDRFGNRIAARDVPPKSYLPSAIPASSFLSAGQRIDAEMAFVDPGSNAVGFEIDACLPAPGGSIACANDAGAR